jgi:imidazolonepropionase-like amidohydrolase
MKINILYLFFLCALPSIAQKNQKKLLLNGVLHVGNGEIFNNAAIGIENDKIIFIKNSLAYSYLAKDWDTIIDLQNQHVYPGFVAPNSTLGLTEIDAVRATNDFREVGELNPHIRSLIAYNAESKVISTVRTNGVLITQATPREGVISGSSSVLHLGGWNWEDAVIKADDGIHLNWPTPIKQDRESKKAHDYIKNENYLKHKNEIDLFFSSAKAYLSTVKNVEKDLRYEAMDGIFNGEKRVYFHADDIQQLLDIIEFSKKHQLKFPVIIGGYDTYLCADRIKDANIPIMLPRVHSLPMHEDDPIDLPYKLPFLLYKAGIKFCLQNEGDMEAMNTRNLPFLAGTAASYGLPQEEAVRSISLSACEIIGINNYYGSIEVGKKATLFVSKGNALEIKSNDVTLIMMDGNVIDTSNFQKELYNKYKKKYEK